MAAERDSTETKARLLEAATEEFAAHGIAGARVDRIAAAANANKQLIYVYLAARTSSSTPCSPGASGPSTEDVPSAPDDLAGYVGRLFDYLVEHPDVLRLATWAGLERPTAVAAFEADSYRTKLIAIADAQRDGWLDASFAPVPTCSPWPWGSPAPGSPPPKPSAPTTRPTPGRRSGWPSSEQPPSRPLPPHPQRRASTG